MTNTSAMHPGFSQSYREARQRFLDAVENAGALLISERYPDSVGPDGEELAQDLAIFGDPAAEKCLLALSGTHGPEGYAGNAIQLDWIARQGNDIPAGVAVALLHGVNPWGFAYGQRTTQNDVDLNRNFVDDAARAVQADALFDEIARSMAIEEPGAAAFAAFHEKRQALIDKHGVSRYTDVLARGQYSHPQDVIYGGASREWSNQSLERLLSQHLAPVKKMGLIDWHTGLGERGELFFICFNEEPALFQKAVSWWGHRVERDAGGFDGADLPRYTGTVCQGVFGFMDHAQVVGAVIEMGTYPFGEMTDALLVENWLRSPAGRASPDRDYWLAWTEERFNPASNEWQTSVLSNGREVMDQALRGVIAWD